MTYALHDLLVTDAVLDRIAGRDGADGDDLVLAGLAALASAVDDLPLPPPVTVPPTARTLSDPPMTRAHKGGLALAAAVALMVTSTGVAAAVTGDAWAPLRYVAHQVQRLGPHGSSQLPGWDLNASGRLSRHPFITHVALATDGGGPGSSYTSGGSQSSGFGAAGPVGRAPGRTPHHPISGPVRARGPQSGPGRSPRSSRPGDPVGGSPGGPGGPVAGVPTDPRRGDTQPGDRESGHSLVPIKPPVRPSAPPVVADADNPLPSTRPTTATGSAAADLASAPSASPAGQ